MIADNPIQKLWSWLWFYSQAFKKGYISLRKDNVASINCRMSRNKITQNDNVKVCMNRGRKCVYLVCHGTYRYPSIIKLIHHDLSFVISFVVLFKQNLMGLIKYYRILYEMLFEIVRFNYMIFLKKITYSSVHYLLV